MKFLFKYIIPEINSSDLISTLKVALIGACLAGLYGACHDQITYLISDEYFYKLKFKQFSYLDIGFGDRIFVATIGFFTAWWFGFLIGWFLGRRYISSQPKAVWLRKIKQGFILVFIFALAFFAFAGIHGCLLDPNHDYFRWANTINYYGVVDARSFVRVAYIHDASYFGGLVGLMVTFYFIKPLK